MNQMVNPIKSPETTIFLWFTYGFPMAPTTGTTRGCRVFRLQLWQRLERRPRRRRGHGRPLDQGAAAELDLGAAMGPGLRNSKVFFIGKKWLESLETSI